jgi:hypothetical protein
MEVIGRRSALAVLSGSEVERGGALRTTCSVSPEKAFALPVFAKVQYGASRDHASSTAGPLIGRRAKLLPAVHWTLAGQQITNKQLQQILSSSDDVDHFALACLPSSLSCNGARTRCLPILRCQGKILHGHANKRPSMEYKCRDVFSLIKLECLPSLRSRIKDGLPTQTLFSLHFHLSCVPTTRRRASCTLPIPLTLINTTSLHLAAVVKGPHRAVK